MVLSAAPDRDDELLLTVRTGNATGIRFQAEGQAAAKALHAVDLIRFWNDSANPVNLSQHHPQATLSGVTRTGVAKQAVVELSEPAWDPAAKNHTYRVRLMAQSSAVSSTPSPAVDEELQAARLTLTVAHNMLPLAAPPSPLLSSKGLQVFTTQLCAHSFDTSGEVHRGFFGDEHPNFMSLCRPDVPPDAYFVSDAAVGTGSPYYAGQPPVFPVLLVRPDGTAEGKTALAKPTALIKIWSTDGTHGEDDFTIFQPQPPEGYVCLGVLASAEPWYSIPPNYRCVRRDLVQSVNKVAFIWNDRHSGADWDVIMGSPGASYVGFAWNVPQYGITYAANPGPSSSDYPDCPDYALQSNLCTPPYTFNPGTATR